MERPRGRRGARAGRERILAVAAKLFRQNGYAGTTMRAIAAKCRIQAPSLYHHFRSKDEILAEIFRFGVETIFEDVARAVEVLPEDAPAREKVRAAIGAHLNAFYGYQDYTVANIRVFEQAPPSVRKKNLPQRDRYEAYWNDLFVEARRRGEIRRGVDLGALRRFLFGAMNVTVDWYRAGSGKTIDELADDYADILFRGVGTDR